MTSHEVLAKMLEVLYKSYCGFHPTQNLTNSRVFLQILISLITTVSVVN